MVAQSGKAAVQNGREVKSGYSGMCQMYVRDQCWEVPSLYGSAIEAWNGARHKHPGDRTPPKGAPCYYRGGQYGHAVIWAGGDDIRSTDCTSSNDISEVDLGWPERAWGFEYLGWTGDLNGVDLPLGEEGEDMPLSDDDAEKVARKVWNFMVTNVDDGDDAKEQHAKVMLAQTHARAGKAARNTKGQNRDA